VTWLWIAAWCVGFVSPGTAQVVDTTLYRLIQSRIDGPRTFEDVAYYTQFWRIAGTPAFDQCIDYTVRRLEDAGFQPQSDALLRYWIDEEPIPTPAWVPSGGMLQLERPERHLLHTYEDTPVLLCRNSFPAYRTAEVVFVEEAAQDAGYGGVDVRGKIVLSPSAPGAFYHKAVVERGALGILSGYMADYNRPDLFPDAIHDGEIPYDPDRQSFGMMVSTRTLNRLRGHLDRGETVRVTVRLEAGFQIGLRRTLGAEIAGDRRPYERVVLVSHIDHYKPGANDNASGAATLLEIARTAGLSIRQGALRRPGRTLTFLWVDEYRGTALWMNRHPQEAQNVYAALVLDMVGERTDLTGGPFRVERMPDPAAVWTRPPDEHTPWGAGKADPQRIQGHFLNDFYLSVCRQYAAGTGWEVQTNPWEGGSDHDLFLERGIPAVLNWHFPDYFYHTSLDGLDKVDPDELRHAGIVAMAAALTLASASETTAYRVLEAVRASAEVRFAYALRNSRTAMLGVPRGDERIRQEAEERAILMAWTKWYEETLESIISLPLEGSSDALRIRIEQAKRHIGRRLAQSLGALAELEDD
jgi:hypothetical protein